MAVSKAHGYFKYWVLLYCATAFAWLPQTVSYLTGFIMHFFAMDIYLKSFALTESELEMSNLFLSRPQTGIR